MTLTIRIYFYILSFTHIIYTCQLQESLNNILGQYINKMVVNFILSIFWINLFLFIWFKTDAFISYCKLFRLSRVFKIDDFENYKMLNPVADYLSFIRINYKNFFIKIITCVPCFLFWICVFILIIYKLIVLFPIVYLLSYSIYQLLNKYVY